MNGNSVGIQIVSPYRYDISSLVKKGENKLTIEVATILESEVGKDGITAKMTWAKSPVYLVLPDM